MLIASTTTAPSMGAIMGQVPLGATTEVSLAQTLLQCLYVKIFLPKEGILSPMGERLSVTLTQVIKQLEKSSFRSLEVVDGSLSTQALLTFAMRTGLWEDPFYKALTNWLVLAYGETFATVDNLPAIFFDNFGRLYDATLMESFSIAIPYGYSVQQATNLTPLSPEHRIFAVMAKTLCDTYPHGPDLFVTNTLPLFNVALDPVALYQRASQRVPLANFASMIQEIANISTLSESRSSTIIQTLWTHFYSFNNTKVLLEAPTSCRELLNTISSYLSSKQKEQSPCFINLYNTINLLCSPTNREYHRGIGLIDEDTALKLKVSLEAVDLISEDAVNGDTSDTGSSSSDSGDDTKDESTTGDSANTEDNSDEEQGDNPSTIVSSSSPNAVNNNSIGETSGSGTSPRSLAPDDDSAKSLDQKGKEYVFRMSVSTLNSRLREDPDLTVPTESRENLDHWCRLCLWIYPVAKTKSLVKEWGLGSFLSSSV